MLTGLLPAKPVAAGESWLVPNAAAQALAAYDGLVGNDLRCKLAKLDEEQARITFAGSLNGITRGRK